MTGIGLTRKVPYSKGMSPALAAFRVIVCAVALLGVTTAHAERRPVAVVNLDLTDAPATQELATQLDAVLREHPELRTLPVTGDTAALYERVDDPDGPGILRAHEFLQRAEQELAQFSAGQAIAQARDGQQILLSVNPSASISIGTTSIGTIRLYADLSFLEGRALREAGRIDEMKLAFLQSHRLDPSRTLNPAELVPEDVQAYEAAKTATAAPGSIEVKGTGHVWIDGTEVGTQPGTFATTAGPHVVWLTGVDRETRGMPVVVSAGATTQVTIPDAEASRRTRVQRARQDLARAPDPSARAAAMRRLAQLVGVQDAVLLSMTNGKVIVQTWRAGNVERAPGFSALRERGKATPGELLTPLAPPKEIVPVEPPRPVKPIVTKQWYEKPTYQVGLFAAVVGVIVGGYFLTTLGPDSFQNGTGVGFDMARR